MSTLFLPPIVRSYLPSAAALLIAFAYSSLPVRAAVEVQGEDMSVQIVADNAKISEVLSALATSLKGFSWKEIDNLDGAISGTYKGSVEDVLGRVLRGFDYVIKTQETTIEIVVIGRSRSAPAAVAPVLRAIAPPPTPPVSAAVAPVPTPVAPIPGAVAAMQAVGLAPASDR